jgi:hypothetical protein
MERGIGTDLMGFPGVLHERSYRRHQELHISLISILFMRGRASIRGVITGTYPHNPQETQVGPKVYPAVQIGGFSMTSDRSEAAIEEIVARCNGDVHGALKALLLVNEQLEAELTQLYAAVALGGPFERGDHALH